MPSRRVYLTSVVAAGLGGCVGTPLGTTTDTSTDATTTAPPTTSQPAVTIPAAAVQYSYRHIQNVDWNAIRPAEGQFVVVTVDATEADPVPGMDAFSLVTSDNTYDSTVIEHRYPVDLDVPGEPYMTDQDDADPRGWIVFDVPAQLDTAPSLRLAHETGSWEWELDTERATTPPPDWEWSASAPETVAPDDTFDITVTAENVGDGAGTFRGAVNFSYPLYRPKGFAIDLAPGASGETTVSASSEEIDPERQLDYGIRTPGEESTVTVTVKAESTSTSSSTANTD